MSNLLIKVLKYAVKQNEFTFTDLEEGAPLTEEEERERVKKLIHSKDLFYVEGADFLKRVKNTENQPKIYTRAEDHFRLLEHQELKDARKASFWATCFAIIAIIISIISTGFSIYYSNKSISSDVNLPNKLYDSINYNSEQINTELRRLDKRMEKMSHIVEKQNKEPLLETPPAK